MKKSGPLFLLVFILVLAVVMALNMRLKSHRREARDPFPTPESLPQAPDLDSLPGDSLLYGRLLQHRRQLDTVFQGDESPLEESDRAHFAGLKYFPFDPSYRLLIKLTPPERRDQVILMDTKGTERTYERFGVLNFALQGQAQRLTLFRDPGHGYYFLPFRDMTTDRETYGVGRYVEPKETAPGLYLIDFNYAYNPYCAYSNRWSCPVPPAENRLTVAVRAGEMKFHPDS